MGTYVNNLRLLEITTGDESGTWGTKTNTNLELIADAFGSGTEAITTNADTHTTTIADGSADEGRAIFLKYTGTLDSACTITLAPNTVNKLWFIENATSGSQNIIISQGSGANITIGNGNVAAVYTDGAGSGAAVLDAFADLELSSTLTVAGAITGSSTVQGTTITATTAFVPDASDGAALGTSSLEFSDLFLADGAVVSFGDDDDVTLTHVADTGLLLNSTMAIQFNDASQYINAPTNAILDINATDEIELNATAVDLNGTLDVSGTSTFNSNVSITVADNSATLQLISTDDDNGAGPLILLDRDTASPADGDAMGRIYSQGRNDADELITYSQMTTKAIDVSDGTEDGELLFNLMVNGSSTTVLDLYGPTTQMNTDTFDLNGNLDVSGTSTLTGNVSAGADIIIGATDKLRLDGSASGNTYLSESAGDVVTLTTEGLDSFLFASSGGNPYIRLQAGNTGVGAIQYYENDGGSGQVLLFQAGIRGADNKYYISSNATIHSSYALRADGQDIDIGGALSKASGSFKIDHPLPSMKDTHDLYHSFIEGPRADLIYRGQIDLVDGQATVEMNAEFGMTAGTWELLCRDATCFTTNETGWDMVKGSVSGSTLTIQCQESDCTDTVSWLVVAERQDQHMYDTEWTDSNGRPILEREKPEEVEDL